MIVIGVDPGKTGGIAVLSGIDVEALPYSDDNLVTTAMAFQDDAVKGKAVAVVESVHAMPHQGVSSCFTFGKSFGYILGVFDSFKIPVVLVPPQKWKRYFELSSSKQESIDLCKKKHGNINLRRTEKCKVDSDGMAESVLIADWGMENEAWNLLK